MRSMATVVACSLVGGWHHVVGDWWCAAATLRFGASSSRSDAAGAASSRSCLPGCTTMTSTTLGCGGLVAGSKTHGLGWICSCGVPLTAEHSRFGLHMEQGCG
jgi:hypothetical protein